MFLLDTNVPGDFEKAEEFGGRILELCVAVGGCITGEHGVGIEKLRQMPAQFTDSELEQLHAIKHAFDPSGSLNPGKSIPTLRQCQEYRTLARVRESASPGSASALSGRTLGHTEEASRGSNIHPGVGGTRAGTRDSAS